VETGALVWQLTDIQMPRPRLVDRQTRDVRLIGNRLSTCPRLPDSACQVSSRIDLSSRFAKIHKRDHGGSSV